MDRKWVFLNKNPTSIKNTNKKIVVDFDKCLMIQVSYYIKH